MKPSHTYNAELFNLDGKVFSKIVIANGEASFFVKALLVVIIMMTISKQTERMLYTAQMC